MNLDLVIQYAKKEELNAVFQLWNKVFGDDESFFYHFMDSFFDDNVLIGKIEDKIVAMATLLPAEILISLKKYPISYVYACATDKKYRGNGIMACLLERAYHDVALRDELGLFLLPAHEKLYDYYEKNGFAKFFSNQQYYFSVQTFHSSNPTQNINAGCHDAVEDFYLQKNSFFYGLDTISIKEYFDLRTVFLTTDFSIHFPLTHLQFMIESEEGQYYNLYKLHVKQETKGIAFVKIVDDRLEILEFLCSTPEVVHYVHLLLETFIKQHSITKFTFAKSKLAMLRSENSVFEGKQGYFNFGLE